MHKHFKEYIYASSTTQFHPSDSMAWEENMAITKQAGKEIMVRMYQFISAWSGKNMSHKYGANKRQWWWEHLGNENPIQFKSLNAGIRLPGFVNPGTTYCVTLGKLLHFFFFAQIFFFYKMGMRRYM